MGIITEYKLVCALFPSTSSGSDVEDLYAAEMFPELVEGNSIGHLNRNYFTVDMKILFMQVFYSILTASFYLLLTGYFWRVHWRVGASQMVESKWLEQIAMILPLLSHVYVLIQAVFTPAGLDLGIGNSVSMTAWITVLAHWLWRFYRPTAGLETLLMGLAAVMVLFALILPISHIVDYAALPGFKAHFVVAMLAYSALMIAALLALMLAGIERLLHGKPEHLNKNLPPLLTVENLLFQMIAVGFALLTLTVLSGVFFSEQIVGQPLQFNHKTVFSLFSWLIFAVLLIGRKAYGWRGKTAIRWTLVGFAMLLLGYVGSKFVLEVILQR